MKRETSWFKIDNAGKLFPIVTNEHRASYFRLSVSLKESVDPVILQRAAILTLNRFPNFNTRLKRGLFWNYLEIQRRAFHVIPEPNTFGALPQPYAYYKHLTEIYYHRNRISVEIFHAITDGRGGLEFIKTLTLTYLQEIGLPIHSDGLIFDVHDPESGAQLEDSYAKKITKGKAVWLPTKKAFHLKGDYFNHFGHDLTHLHVPTSAMLTIARSRQTTITAIFATILILYFIQLQKKQAIKKRKPIIISIPVDMRKYLPSKTMKNFVMTINIGKVFSLNSSFDDVLLEVNRQLSEGQKIDVLTPQIRANMKAERLLFLRFVPLFLKRLLVKYVFNKVGEPALSFTMSNLGRIDLPIAMSSYVNHFEFMICSTKILPVNLGVISYGEQLVLSFSRIIQQRDLIQFFSNYLIHNFQISIHVTNNRWEETT
jgi:NRPS condensation-like uncharacterized protein